MRCSQKGQTDRERFQSESEIALMGAFILMITFTVIQAVAGFAVNSLALLSSAILMLSTACAIGAGYRNQTTGMDCIKEWRVAVLPCLQGFSLFLASIIIFLAAVQRIIHPPEIESMGMLLFSIIGLFVSAVSVQILKSGMKGRNKHVSCACRHVLREMLMLAGVSAGGLLIHLFGWEAVDPAMSMGIGTLIMAAGLRTVRDSNCPH